MGQNKHQPKDSKNRFSISIDAEKVLIGIAITLISVIGLLNRGPLGEFLTYISVYLFGAFYIFFYFMFIFIGLYLAIKKKFITFKMNLYVLGAVLFCFGLMLIASLTMKEVTINNLLSVYNNHMKTASSTAFKITNFNNVGMVGGGFIATFFVALLNSCITSVGTTIIVILLIIAGICILLKDPLKRLFSFIKRKIGERKEKKKAKGEPISEEKLDVNSNSLTEEESKQSDYHLQEEEHEYQSSLAFKSYEPNLVRQVPLVNEEEVQEEITEDEKENNIEEDVKTHSSFFSLFHRTKKEEKNEEKLGELKEEDQSEDLETNYQKTPAFEISEESISNEMSLGIKNLRPEVEKETVNVTGEKGSEKMRYILPGVDMLSEHTDNTKREKNINESISRANRINEVFGNFKIRAQVISYNIGPSVTRFNVKTDPGVRVNSISSLVNEVQVALNGDKSVRIEPVVQGKDTSGIEVGNLEPTTVSFKDCFAWVNNQNLDKLTVPLGQDIGHEVITISIDDLPHLLVAGTTGSGKSVFIHTIIMTLIMRNYPDELRLIMIDPKKVEFAKYNNIPHLYCPIITDQVQATAALYKLINEMERRFTIMAREEVVNIKEYRKKQKDDPSKEIIPSIVVIIDEFADLISNNAKEVEPQIQRLAQKARAAGIYLIIATQRPSVNVITGDIKANIPARVALSVSSSFDSKTILDEVGAETLIGKGDLLARIPTSKALVRVQSAFVDNEEISRVTSYLKSQGKPVFNQEFLNLRMEKESGGVETVNSATEKRLDQMKNDPLYPEIKNYVISTGKASSSSLGRHFGLGFNRAAAFLDAMEEEGLIKTVSNGRKVVIASEGDDYE